MIVEVSLALIAVCVFCLTVVHLYPRCRNLWRRFRYPPIAVSLD